MTSAQIFWACLALVLIAAETVAPEVFLLWLGFAAGSVFLLLLGVPGLEMVWQGVTFAVMGFVFIFAYVKFLRGRGAPSDQPLLNRKTEQLIGQVFPLDQAIVDGRGRLKIGDAYWVVEGPDLAQGVRVRVLAARSMSLQVGPVD